MDLSPRNDIMLLEWIARNNIVELWTANKYVFPRTNIWVHSTRINVVGLRSAKQRVDEFVKKINIGPTVGLWISKQHLFRLANINRHRAE